MITLMKRLFDGHNRLVRLALASVVLLLAAWGPSLALAASGIDTTGAGCQLVTWGGNVGQTILAPQLDSVLQSFDIHIPRFVAPSSLAVSVYAWDGSRPVGDAIYQGESSGVDSSIGASNGGSYFARKFTFNTSGVYLRPATQYIILTSLRDVFSCGNPYPNGGTVAALSNGSFYQAESDMAFSASFSTLTDHTAPTSSASQRPSAPQSGWNTTPVDVTITGSDDQGGTGVRSITYTLNNGAKHVSPANPTTFTLNNDGIYTINYFATDIAYNEESPAHALAVKIDQTRPHTAAQVSSSSAPHDGWYRGDVTLRLSASDATSGISELHYQINDTPAVTINDSSVSLPTFTADGVYTITFHAIDNAGNAEDEQTLTINLDTAAPRVACASADQQWHNSNVQIACTAGDSGSGLANSADASFNLSTNVLAGSEETNAATNSRQVCDAANNCTTAGPISANKIDRKAPSITISAPTNTTYFLNQAVAASYSCADGGSGVATCAGPVANGSPINTASVGAKSFAVNATDTAGNNAQQSVGYSVVYNFRGFMQPVDNLPTVNTVKAGSAVPIKFSLSGNQGLNIFAAGSPASRSITCNSGALVDDIEQTVTAGASSLSYDAASDTYSYVWKTDKAWTGTCRQLSVTLADGTTHSANFKFK